MKRYIQFLTIVLSAAALVACNEKETPLELAGGKEIQFSASIGTFQVKATDTAFEKGDAIGLFADDPVSASNARLSWDGNALVPDTPLHWGVNQDVNQSVPFYAYYPYAANTGKQFKFSVPADQRAAAAYEAADLMLASTSAAPKDTDVRLNFSHKMARVIFYVESHFPNTEVTELTVSGPALDVDVDLTVPSLKTSGQASTINAALVGNESGAKAWAVILPAQTISEMIVSVKLSDGSVYELPAVRFNGSEGRSFNATIIIDEALTQPTFSATVTDWLDYWVHLGKTEDPGVQEHTWYVEYNGGLLPFDKQADGTYHQVFAPSSNWADMRIIKDNYAEVWGCAIPSYYPYVNSNKPTETVVLAPNYYLYIEGETGLFDLVLDTAAKTLTITMLNHDWYSLGTGIFIDDFVSNIFGLPHEEIEVEVLADRNVPSLFRIMEPYKNWSWASYFNYSEGAYIDFHIMADNTVWFGESFTGLNMSSYGDFYVFSLVPETGWSNYSYYGTYYPDYGFIQFKQNAAMTLTSYGKVYANKNGMTSLTLPGYERPVHYYDFTDSYVDNYIAEDGQRYFRTEITTGMDLAKIKYGVYSGSLSRGEVYGNNKDGVFYTQVIPEGTELDFVPDDYCVLEVPVPATGTYTIVWYGENAAGEQVFGTFSPYWVVFDGDEVPEATAAISAAPAQPLSDIQIKAHVDFPDPSQIFVLAIPEAEFVQSGYTEDSIYDLVLSYGQQKNVYYVHSQNGADYILGTLDPNTQYRVMVAGTNKWGNSTWAQTTVSTDATPTFTSLGKGRYTDNFLLEQKWIEEPYTTEVEILKADTDPVRYRIVAPYKEFWSTYANQVPFSGFYAANIDCYVDGESFIYDHYYTGYLEDGYGDVRYWSENPFSGQHYPNNCVLQEGVFNIAPYAMIEGSNYIYNLTNYKGVIYVELPGYTYTPEQPAGAPRLAPRKGGMQEAQGMTASREFTRHMLFTGSAKVTRSGKDLSEISAETLK